MPSERTRILVAAALLLAAYAPAPGVEPRPRAPTDDRALADRFEATLDSLRREKRIPGLAAVVLRDTTLILARGYGWADVERQVPVTPETPFNIASVSKPISGVVALRLVEQGVLDLDRPMSSFANFREFCTDVREAGGIFFSDFACEGDALTLRHVLMMQANGTPGTRFWYNPPAFSWASRPMAEVGGAPFSDLVARLVFAPAGMTRSARIHRRLELPPALAAELALPYHVDSAGRFVRSSPPPPQGDGAAGGVVSTALDLARFDEALAEGRLLTPESLRLMWTEGRSPSGAALLYGIGWFVKEHAGERLLWHTGLWEGAYSALYLKVPERRLTLILLANSEGLRWEADLDEAAIERSPFATAFLAAFPR